MPCIAATSVDGTLVDIEAVLACPFKTVVAVAAIAPDGVRTGRIVVAVVGALS